MGAQSEKILGMDEAKKKLAEPGNEHLSLWICDIGVYFFDNEPGKPIHTRPVAVAAYLYHHARIDAMALANEEGNIHLLADEAKKVDPADYA